jgi:periplasmic protein TonB
MTRGLGTGLALSIVAHGGAVAAVGILGAAWIGAPPSIAPQPALFVDLVQAVVATSDRIGAADAAASRPRSVPAVASGAGPVVPMPRGRVEVVPPGNAPPPAAGPTDGPTSGKVAAVGEGPTHVVPDVPRPPAAPVPIGPHPLQAASAPERVAGPPPVAVAPAASSTSEPAPPAKPEVASVPPPVPGTSAPEPSAPGSVAREASSPPGDAGLAGPGTAGTSWHPSSAPESGQATSASAGRDSAAQPAAQPGSGVSGAGSRGAVDVARLAPGEGGIPPEYDSYVRALRQRVEGRLAYPWTAARRAQQGVVELEVRVSSEGRLVGVEVVAGATADTLRAAAVAAVRGAAPFPFPPGVEGRPLVIRLPVEFRLR